MSKTSDYIIARARGLWRSRTVRLCWYGCLVWVFVWLTAGNAYSPAAVLGQVEPILVQSAAFKLFATVVGVVAVQNVLAAFDNLLGLSFSKDWLPELRAGNLAVSVYLGGRFIGACLLVAAGIG